MWRQTLKSAGSRFKFLATGRTDLGFYEPQILSSCPVCASDGWFNPGPVCLRAGWRSGRGSPRIRGRCARPEVPVRGRGSPACGRAEVTDLSELGVPQPRCIHADPSIRHSWQPFGVRGDTGRITFRCGSVSVGMPSSFRARHWPPWRPGPAGRTSAHQIVPGRPDGGHRSDRTTIGGAIARRSP